MKPQGGAPPARGADRAPRSTPSTVPSPPPTRGTIGILRGFGPIRGSPGAVSVAIPTRNGGARFREVLEALEGQDLGFELLIVDSGSSDGTPEAAVAAGARVVSIAPRDFQHGRTRNLAIGLSSGDRIVLLTQDARPARPDCLRRLVSALDDPAIDGAWARQTPRPGCDPILEWRLGIWMRRGQALVRQTLAPGDPRSARRVFGELAARDRVDRCAFDHVAACIRRSSWERHPLPEVSFGEDVAWAREVLLAGGSLAWQPAALVEHSHPLRPGRELARIYRDHRNLSRLFGLHAVPGWREVLPGIRSQWALYRRLLAEAPMGGPRRLLRQALAGPYALGESLAQLLATRGRRARRWDAPEDARAGFPGARAPLGGKSPGRPGRIG